VDARTSLTPITDALEPDTDMAALLAPYEAALASTRLGAIVAYAPRAISRAAPRHGDSALGNLVAHAMVAASGAGVAVINTTGIRADIAQGAVTSEELFSVAPFEDALVVRRVSVGELGRAMDRAAEASCSRGRSQVQLEGMTVTLECANGRPRARLLFGGRSLDPSAMLRLATTSFLTESGSWFAVGSPDGTPPRSLHDVLHDFVLRLPPCADGRLPCLDASDAAGARVDGRIEWR
jgi:2',3'-cyclic-nucleotide 2'-phosphodiesterase (5'-nucleotidase family)